MKTQLQIFLAAVAISLFVGKIFVADAQDGFADANRLYDEGKFSDAANGYEKILQSGSVSPSLFFNYGNAEFKSGRIGRAIAAFRRAAQLAPRDSDARANLEFVRNQVQGPTLRESRWQNWLGALTLNEWTTLAAMALWITFALLAAMQIRPALRPALRGLSCVFGIVAILFCAGVGADAAIYFSKPIAVVVAPDAMARSGPFDEAQSEFTVYDGAELAVTDQRDDWLQVTDGLGRIGWLERKQVEISTEN
ncbi:MAG: tetratricopeptide repeat protein [Verrucomicrobiota bacterium]|jgi:tetratricopeptide (TPR) repeat protein